MPRHQREVAFRALGTPCRPKKTKRPPLSRRPFDGSPRIWPRNPAARKGRRRPTTFTLNRPRSELAASEGALGSPRAGERVSGSILTRLLLPLSQRSHPRPPATQRKLSFAPRSRTQRIVVTWNPSVGHFQSAETSCPRPPTGLRPASNDPPKSLPRKRLSGFSPGIGSPHSTRRGLPGEETFSRTELGLPTKGDSNFFNHPCNRRQRLWTVGVEAVCAMRSTRATG